MSTFTTRKALPRRTFLRGLGTTLGLPLLDAMVPAATAATRAAQPAKRLAYIFIPMGCDLSRWTPPGKDTLDELSPILSSLAPVRQHVSVISNLELQPAYPGTHATSNAAFLSAAHAKHTESTDYFLGITADQIAAQQIGRQTQLPSLELAMDLMQTVGQCDNGYACVYQNNLSWSSPTTPLPAEAHPRLVFERLFGEGGSKAERSAALKQRASLLDFVKDDMSRLSRTLGPEDRQRVDHYLESVREVERRIQKAEAGVAENPLPDLDRPVGVPAAYADHARLLFDLQVLAMQGDVTRVSTFQLARETSNRTYPEIGVSDPHHPLSHHGNDPAKIEKFSKINAFHVSLFAEFVAKLAATSEAEGSLLDHTLCLYGSGMGNPNVHDHTNLPVIVAGGAASGMKGGRHLRYDKPVPLANLHLTLLDKAGVKLDRFGDSQGKISGLFDTLSI
uniref:Signal peptide n=1 Tax=uncultured Verrucomicrobiota bacterium TaxID=156588 RepID=D2DXV8_9BACT|nr:signal peptide [uncultured Verrucomicrobiota bacterium]